MTTDKRWDIAQDYERGHWKKLAASIASSQKDLSWYDWKACRLRTHFLSQVGMERTDEVRVLEVGSGPVGIVSFLTAKRRCAIDPLADFYASHPDLVRLRDAGVEYLTGGGESLPFAEESFDLVIIDNVIDHTKSPTAVLSEIRRVLRIGGVLYLSVNVHSSWGLGVRNTMEVLRLDKGHPHNYTVSKMRSLVERMAFTVVFDEREDLAVAKRKELQDGRLRSKLKLILGIYDVVYEIVACRS